MQISRKQQDFIESEEGLKIKNALRVMESDSGYYTVASYCANISAYPDNLMPFVDKHMKYLSEHQNVDPAHYLSNLRLQTRLK